MTRYTAITFAPVQGFIEKSRKLRDLYGSSFILSFLAKSLCNYITLHGGTVIVPALTNVTRGVPNNIYLTGIVDEAGIRAAFDRAWRTLVDTCRHYLDREYQIYAKLPLDRPLPWKREWNLWANYTWELFIVCGKEDESFDDVRERMNDRKQARDWAGVNWCGESSTLSGSDAIAYPEMTNYHPVRTPNPDAEIRDFYQFLSKIERIEDAIEPTERLSIPELIKRLITYQVVREKVDQCRNLGADEYLASIEHLPPFSDINRKDKNIWTGWFQGDGDQVGKYVDTLVDGNKDDLLNLFSQRMLAWGEALQGETNDILGDRISGRIVYAGGDDFLGVLYPKAKNGKELTPQECMKEWWYGFNKLWNKCEQPISVSTGFVWAAPNVPQRDLLQHLRDTEKTAKKDGRDRLAIRILFNSGNHLDWSCPWRWLEPILTGYRDREGQNNWTHIYNDIAILEARNAFSSDIATLEARNTFSDDDTSIAQGIFDIYFPNIILKSDDQWWNPTDKNPSYQRLSGGLLGTKPDREKDQIKRRNQWIIALAKVGFHLFR